MQLLWHTQVSKRGSHNQAHITPDQRREHRMPGIFPSRFKFFQVPMLLVHRLLHAGEILLLILYG